MIDETFIIYLMFQIVLFVINLIGYKTIPILGFFGIIGSVILAIPTLNAFGDYYMMAFFLTLINISLPVIGITRAFR